MYLLEAIGPAMELKQEEYSKDWKEKLEAGSRVIPAVWWNLVGSPGKAPHYYTRGEGDSVRVPTNLLLVAGIEAPLAVAKDKSPRCDQSLAAKKGGVVITKDVADDVQQELEVREDLESA